MSSTSIFDSQGCTPQMSIHVTFVCRAYLLYRTSSLSQECFNTSTYTRAYILEREHHLIAILNYSNLNSVNSVNSANIELSTLGQCYFCIDTIFVQKNHNEYVIYSYSCVTAYLHFADTRLASTSFITKTGVSGLVQIRSDSHEMGQIWDFKKIKFQYNFDRRAEMF